MIIGIDASNIKEGGGVTHLVNLLKASNPKKHNFIKIVIWCNKQIYPLIPNKKWISKKIIFDGNINFIKMFIWQKFFLSNKAKKERCAKLFFPGGIYFGKFRPYITMSQNMIPFEEKELKRYFPSIKFVKFLLIKIAQIYTFKRAQNIIFLTSYAKKKILNTIQIKKKFKIIEHGIDESLKKKIVLKKKKFFFNKKKEFKLLYVSTIDKYKHQVNVILAINSLREKKNWNLKLTLVGDHYGNELNSLIATMKDLDPNKEWIKYKSKLDRKKLIKLYSQFDLGIFASSCENLSNIILEKISSGLPIVCSNVPSVSFWLKNYENKFNPLNPLSLEKVLVKIIPSNFHRYKISKNYKILSNRFNWNLSAKKTFELINKSSLN
jgi:glycosyltransferase involved in cell wall biosynthesis